MEIRNRSASYEYYIEERYDAGMVLSGTEVKSIRDGKVSFNDSFCLIDKGEIWVKNLHIAEYTFGTYANHPAVRDRKLLLKKKEIRKLINKLKDKGYTIIPLKIWFSDKGFAKIQIGLARGKKLHDKRASVKEREAKKELRHFTNKYK
jgi:SsrA-binding protein